MQAVDESDSSGTTRRGCNRALGALFTPRDEALLAGKVDPTRPSFIERITVKMVKLPGGRGVRRGAP